jgi:hypothetical protein
VDRLSQRSLPLVCPTSCLVARATALSLFSRQRRSEGYAGRPAGCLSRSASSPEPLFLAARRWEPGSVGLRPTRRASSAHHLASGTCILEKPPGGN